MTDIKTPPVQAMMPTEESIKAKINLELTKNKFQNILQECENITFDKNDLQKDVPKLQSLRKAVTVIDKYRSVLKKPYLDAGKLVDKVAKDISDPLEKILTQKETDYRKIAQQIEQERQQQEKENSRIQGINQAIDDFILNKTTEIAQANTSQELVSIEKEMIAEQKNKVKYMEFLPQLVERSKEVASHLKLQRKHLENLEKLQEDKMKAEKKGDDEKLLKLMSKEDTLTEKLEESKVVVQETAINQMTSRSSAPVYVAPDAPKARRTTWKFEIDNLEEVFKSDPQLLVCELNYKTATALLNQLKEDGSLKDKKEFKTKGIRFYEHKDY